jgi:hypothetical protein
VPPADPNDARIARQTDLMKQIWHRYGLHMLLLAAIVFMTMPALFAFAGG